MVRLEEENLLLVNLLFVLFQFQYGAIRSQIFIPFNELYRLFQFQYGAIRSYKFDDGQGQVIDISIPVWCD